MERIEKSPNLSSNVRSVEKTPSVLAMEHFDDFYKKVFKTDWPSIRLALLSKSKFCALLNNFADTDLIKEDLVRNGCFSLREHYTSEVNRLRSELSDNFASTVVGPKIPRPKPKRNLDDEDGDLSGSAETEHSMSLEEAAGRVIQPEGAVLGGSSGHGKKLAKSSAMFLHMPSTKLKGMDDFVEESEYYESYERVAGIPIEIRKHPLVEWPARLEAYTFPAGNVEHFQPPKRLSPGSPFNYYCLDAASLLPVIMLDINFGDSVLDMCAGPGGKSLVAMQTLNPGKLLCSDVDSARVKRIMNVMDSYLKDFNKDVGREVIQYKRCDSTHLGGWMPDAFERVLCDVPCYTDRHIVKESI